MERYVQDITDGKPFASRRLESIIIVTSDGQYVVVPDQCGEGEFYITEEIHNGYKEKTIHIEAGCSAVIRLSSNKMEEQ